MNTSTARRTLRIATFDLFGLRGQPETRERHELTRRGLRKAREAAGRRLVPTRVVEDERAARVDTA